MESYREYREKLFNGETTAQEAVAASLEQIEQGKNLNAFITVMNDQAKERAADVDQRIADGTAGPLAGMVLAIKDNIAIADVGLTCGSHILENFTSLYSATAVERLLDADAIIVGKTNLDEFAMGSSNETSYFGNVLNPLDNERVPGGSSGGSAVAVATGAVHGSLGSETGGSVRQPAAFTGVVGVKPTYGRISRSGLVAFASSLDQIGPFARNVYDAALLTQTIAGHDPKDATSSSSPVGDYCDGLDNLDVAGLNIGVPSEYFIDGMDQSVVDGIEQLKHQFRDAGAEIVDISLPHTEYVIPTYYVIATAEASSNLARFDGARYGHRSREASTVEEMYSMSRSEGFGPEVQRRIMLGTFVLSSGYYDAYYRKAQQVRTLIYQDFEKAFGSVDLILAPTTPSGPFRIGEKTDDPIEMYLSDIFTAAANIAGIPAISVPYGKVRENGLPLGVQVMGPHFSEKELFRQAAVVERFAIEG